MAVDVNVGRGVRVGVGVEVGGAAVGVLEGGTTVSGMVADATGVAVRVGATG